MEPYRIPQATDYRETGSGRCRHLWMDGMPERYGEFYIMMYRRFESSTV